MSLRDYPAPILEAWAVWEILRKLGFASDDLFWVFQNTVNARGGPGLTLSVKLVAQDKEFCVTCSDRLEEAHAKELEEQSRSFMAQLNDGGFSPTELSEVLHSSFAWKNKIQFLAALRSKGFVFPFKLN